MSFMLQIDAARRGPLDQLAIDYGTIVKAGPGASIDFCCRVLGVTEADEVVARRLRVSVGVVRGWREIGRRACSGGCQ